MTPAIFGIAGPTLSADERAFFRESDPAGYIVFGRYVVDRAQLRALTDDLRTIHGRERLFILMSRNAQGASSFFKIPSNKVIEVGIQVDL